jgi:hypothetical protein
MGKIRPLTAEEQELTDQGWDQVGESIAAAILEGGQNIKWAWDLIGPLGIYRRYMLDHWLERYKLEHSELNGAPKKHNRRGRPRSAKPKPLKTQFTKKDQIKEALKLLNDQTGR